MPTHTRRARAIFGRDATLAMADVPPVTIPTSVPAAFDDVASGGDDLATLLDRAGDILDRPGVPSGSFEGSSSQRATLNAFKGAPSAYQAASDVAFGAPPSAATVTSASVSARRDAAEASARVDAVGAELRQLAKSVGANVRLPASSAAVVEAEAAARDAAKVARRAEQLKSYGRRRPESSRAARKAGGFSRSLYAQDRERQAAKRAEIEARAAADRAPFITASHGVRLPAPVTAQPPSAVARREAIRAGVVDAAARRDARRARAAKAASAVDASSAPIPWRCNANVTHDVNDPISVQFQDARRLSERAAAASRRTPAGKGRADGRRVDRAKYPSFRAWLDAQAAADVTSVARDAEIRAAIPGLVEEAKAKIAEDRAAARAAKVNAAAEAAKAPALKAFIKLTESFVTDEGNASLGDPAWREAAERALGPAAREAAREAAAIAEGADGVAEATVEDDADAVAAAAAAAAATSAESAYEDDALMRQVEEVETPKKQTPSMDPGIEPATNEKVAVSTPPASPSRATFGKASPRGSPRSLFGPPDANFPPDATHPPSPATRHRRALAAVVEEAERAINANADAETRERIVAKALAEMTPEERTAARAKASKGWSGDFTSAFVKAGPDSASNSGEERPAAPTWSEKPAPGRVSTVFDGGPAAARDAEDAALASSDPDSLAVEFFGPNAAELTFRALHPNAPMAQREPRENVRASVAPSTRAEAAREGGEIDPADPEAAAKAKEVLECQFFGPNADELAFKAVFPDEDLPTKGTVETAEETVETKLEENAGPFEHASGSAGLSVEFIGANANELTFLALHPNAAPPPEGTWATEEEVVATAGALPTTPGNDDGDGVVESADEGADASAPSSPPPFAPLDEPLSEAQERAWASAEVSAPDVPAAAAAGLRGKRPEEDEGAESATKEGADSVTKGADSVGTAAHPVVVTANAQDASRMASAATEMDASAAGLADAADALLAGNADAAARLAETEGEAWVRVPVSMEPDTGATVPTESSSRDPTKGWTPPTVSDETLREADDVATREWDFDDIVARGEELVEEAGAREA